MKRQPLQVVWFKRDLRVADHRPLVHAAAAGPVLPLFVVEPELWRQPDMSVRHYEFVSESLSELREALLRLGQPLVVRVGEVVNVLSKVHASRGIGALWSHEETGNGWTYARDRAVKAWCAERGIRWHEARQDGVVRRLRSRDGWARHWDRRMAESLTPPPTALPRLAGVTAGSWPSAGELGIAGPPCPLRQQGGRRAALSCLESFLTERAGPYRAAMASPLAGEQHCSRLSPHLAWGTLSMREVAQATWSRRDSLRARQQSRTDGWQAALRAFEARLHWHCHFMQKLEDEPELEQRELHPACRALREDEFDAALFAAWRDGQTGLPFVDACMRMLTSTGWINFRMRAMLMAVASYHLWLDWRRTGAHLARLFTDYEPGIHWSQVQMQSGTTGINTLRIYNPVKQGYDQDPDGVFIRRWLPELGPVPDEYLHEPWNWMGAGALLGSAYPAPVVDHQAAARLAKQRMHALRQSPEFHRAAREVAIRHGSRKRRSRRSSTRAERPAALRNLELPFDD